MANPKGNLGTLKPYQPKWKSGQTRTIRVPVAIADEVLNYARKLDDNESLSQVNHSQEVIMILTEALALKANAGGKIKERIKDAIAILQSDRKPPCG